MQPKTTLILGGASSGKSSFAERLVKSVHGAHVYLASARIDDDDDEMSQKIARHLTQRGPAWHTIEEPLDVAGVLEQRTPGETVLFDCATMWLSNQMAQNNDIQAAQTRLIAGLNNCQAQVVTVSNEVGQGVVPDNAIARQFRDAQGRLNVALAAQADLVVVVIAGLPQVLKGNLIL